MLEGLAGCSMKKKEPAGFLMEAWHVFLRWEKDSPRIAGSARNSQRKTTPRGSDHQTLLLKGVKGKLPLGISLISNE